MIVERALSRGPEMTEDGGPSRADAVVVNAMGRRLYFDPRDVRGQRLGEAGGDLNPHSLSLWQRVAALRPWDAYIDVGCNYGEMLAAITPQPGSEVIAFEPNRMVLPRLRRTLAEIGFAVDLREVAVSDRSGNISFVEDKRWSGESHIETNATNSDAYEVAMTTLSDSLADSGHRSACLKVDVEGAEGAVLRGAEDYLVSLDEWAILVEVLHMGTAQLAELFEHWIAYGYDQRSQKLVRLASSRFDVIQAVMEQPWIYRQDVVLVSDPRVVLGWP